VRTKLKRQLLKQQSGYNKQWLEGAERTIGGEVRQPFGVGILFSLTYFYF